MAKRKGIFGAAVSDDASFEVHDAYHTLRHAHNIVQNKSLMKKVKLHHARVKQDHATFDHVTDHLLKTGRISTKALTRVKVPKIKRPKQPHF